MYLLKPLTGKSIANGISQNLVIQPKLKIGQSGDKYEKEADTIADRVMNMGPTDTMQMQPVMEEEEELMQPKLRMQPFEEEEELVQMKCTQCDEGLLQTKSDSVGNYATPFISQQLQMSKGNGTTLLPATNEFMSNAFGNDFSGVQIHTGSEAVKMNQQLGARAFTYGNDIYFNRGEYRPENSTGKSLLAHELTHVIQQGDRTSNRIQRNHFEVRSPFLEEVVTQVSTIEAGIHGRSLRSSEITLASSIFGESIDYNRVSLIPTRILQWRTVGNTIRVPPDFSIEDSYMAETFIHEMTHVWQYQHFGTSYISNSLSDQLIGFIQTGSRNAAYEYTIQEGKTFFEYRVEQQAYIVQIYFNLLREQANPEITAERRTEVERQLAQHQPLIDQMSGALPRSEAEILIERASQVMTVPDYSHGQGLFLSDEELVPEERRMLPITPILEFRFDIGL